jgi:hypothetical protein
MIKIIKIVFVVINFFFIQKILGSEKKVLPSFSINFNDNIYQSAPQTIDQKQEMKKNLFLGIDFFQYTKDIKYYFLLYKMYLSSAVVGSYIWMQYKKKVDIIERIRQSSLGLFLTYASVKDIKKIISSKELFVSFCRDVFKDELCISCKSLIACYMFKYDIEIICSLHTTFFKYCIPFLYSKINDLEEMNKKLDIIIKALYQNFCCSKKTSLYEA